MNDSKGQIISQHTPGPWGFHKDQQEYDVVYAENGDGVAVALLGTTYFPRSTWEANARLIAAAPDLLEALKACREYLDCSLGSTSEINPFPIIDAAIAKAEGRT